MSNVTITKSSPADYVDNPQVDTRRENTDHATDYRPVVHSRDWRYTAVHYAGSAGLIVVVTLLGGIFYFFKCGAPWLDYSQSCEQWSTALSHAPYAIVIVGLFYAAYRLIFCVKSAQVTLEQKRIENARFSLLPDRFGNPTPADLYADMTPADRFDSYYKLLELASQLKAQTAQYEMYPSSLNTLSIGGNSQTVAALPEAIENGVIVTPDDTWRKWLLKAPHLLVAGKTEAGKTTFMTMLLNEYIDNGDQVLILDPHWQPGKWAGLPAVDGMQSILELLPDLQTEMRLRLDQYKAGKLTEEFDRLIVLIDEVPAIVGACIEPTASGRPKLIDPRWPKFASKLGSEARKVGIRVILGSQSTDVQDIMINRQMRDNYTRIGLGNLARVLLAGETDPKRKQALIELLRGQHHAAAMERANEYFVLDTSNVPDLADRPMRQFARPWDVSQMTQPSADTGLLSTLLTSPARPVVAASASGLSADLRTSAKMPVSTHDHADGRTDGLQQARMKTYLLALARQGKSREYARQWAESKGLRFENKLWTEVRKELGLNP